MQEEARGRLGHPNTCQITTTISTIEERNSKMAPQLNQSQPQPPNQRARIDNNVDKRSFLFCRESSPRGWTLDGKKGRQTTSRLSSRCKVLVKVTVCCVLVCVWTPCVPSTPVPTSPTPPPFIEKKARWTLQHTHTRDGRVKNIRWTYSKKLSLPSDESGIIMSSHAR